MWSNCLCAATMGQRVDTDAVAVVAAVVVDEVQIRQWLNSSHTQIICSLSIQFWSRGEETVLYRWMYNGRVSPQCITINFHSKQLFTGKSKQKQSLNDNSSAIVIRSTPNEWEKKLFIYTTTTTMTTCPCSLRIIEPDFHPCGSLFAKKSSNRAWNGLSFAMRSRNDILKSDLLSNQQWATSIRRKGGNCGLFPSPLLTESVELIAKRDSRSRMNTFWASLSGQILRSTLEIEQLINFGPMKRKSQRSHSKLTVLKHDFWSPPFFHSQFWVLDNRSILLDKLEPLCFSLELIN